MPDGVVIDPISRAISAQLDQLSVCADAVRADADDSVHQMRVAVRRIHSLLQTSPRGYGDSAVIVAELRRLAGVLGTARDAEVLAQRYARALDRLAPPLVRGRVAERLVDGAAQRYRTGRAQAVTVMDSPHYRELLVGLRGLVAQPMAGGAAAPVGMSIEAAYRRVCKAAKATTRAGGTGHDEALHRVRKAAKRLRYTAEATGAGLIAERAKAIQTLLGDHQDSVVSRAHLLAEATAAFAAGEDTFTYGLLYQQEDDLAARCRGRLDSALDELDAAVRAAGLPGERVGL